MTVCGPDSSSTFPLSRLGMEETEALQIKDVNMCKLHDFILDFCVGLLENMSMCHEFQKIQVSIRESLRLGKKCIAALPYTVFNGTTFSHMK